MDYIVKIFGEYGITEDEVLQHVTFLSDRGPNIKSGLANGGFSRLNCYAHLLHNLVSRMLTETKVTQIVAQTAKLSAYFKNSGLNTKLKTSLKLYTTTRWNSVFTMIDAIITEFNAAYELLVYKQRVVNEERLKRNKRPENSLTDMASVLNHEELIQIRDFLQPFKVSFEKTKNLRLFILFSLL